MEEICKLAQIDMSYNKILIPNWVKHIKFDIGLSYSAPQSNIWLNRESDLLVFGFEPNPESCSMILSPYNKKLESYHGDVLENRFIKEEKFKLLPIALSDNVGKMDFFITKQDVGCSSLYRPTSTFKDVEKIIQVSVFTLSHFFELLPEDIIIEYIKIDAQGSDLKIIKGGGKHISEKVIWVTLEPESSTYHGAESNSRDEIYKYMTSIGFIYMKHPNTDDPTFFNPKFSNYGNIFIYQKG